MPTTDAWLDKLIFVLIGAVLAWLLHQIRVAWAEDAAVLNEHIKDIEKFSESAQNYWLKDTSSKNEDLALAARVRAAHAATTLLYEQMSEACGTKRDEYKRLALDMFAEATGGDFEDFPRKMDPARAISVHDRAARLIHLLRISRKGLLSMSRLASLRVDFDGPP